MRRPDVAVVDGAIRGALAIRHAALAALAGRAPDAAGTAALGTAPIEAWRLFLEAECCGAALARGLRATVGLSTLPPAAAELLCDRERRERQRILAALAELRQVDAVAIACGVEAIVLKGAAQVADGVPLDLGDVDLSVAPAARDRLADGMLARGYAPPPGVERVAPILGRGAARTFGAHLPPLATSGGIAVELHGADERDIDAAPPLAGYRALRRQPPAAALRMQLHHVIVQHPYRQGHLRDIVSLAAEVARCDASALAEVRAWVASEPRAAELASALDQACALAEGGPVHDPLATRRIVARKYEIVAGRDRLLAAVWQRTVRLAYAPVMSPAVRRAVLRDTLRDDAVDHPMYRRLVRPIARFPRVAALGARLAARSFRLALVLAVVAAGPALRRRVDRTLGARA